MEQYAMKGEKAVSAHHDTCADLRRSFIRKKRTMPRHLLSAGGLLLALMSAWYVATTYAPSSAIAQLLTSAILLVGTLDFAALVWLEERKGETGLLTIPALLLVILTTLFYMILEAVNRFYGHYGFDWASPLVAIVALICSGGILIEKSFRVQAVLACNTLSMIVLWSLSHAEKVTLPF